MDPIGYFQHNDFTESQVLEFSHTAEKQQVVLVCVYANDAILAILQGKKPPLTVDNKIYNGDLRKLVFSGIRDYMREPGPFSELLPYADDYTAKEHGPSISIDRLRITRMTQSNLFEAQITFVNFGFCDFKFTNLHVARKLIHNTGRDAEGNLSYVDVNTMESVDPDKPFGSSQARVSQKGSGR